MTSLSDKQIAREFVSPEGILEALVEIRGDRISLAILANREQILVHSGKIPGEIGTTLPPAPISIGELGDSPFEKRLTALMQRLMSSDQKQELSIGQFKMSGSRLAINSIEPHWLILLEQSQSADTGNLNSQTNDSRPDGNRDSIRSFTQTVSRKQTTDSPFVWETGLDQGLTYLSPNGLTYTGRSLEQIQQMGWLELVHSDDIQNLIDGYDDAFASREPFQLQYRLRRADGEYCWFLEVGVPRYDELDTFTGFVGFCIDVTKSKQVELELAKKRHQLELALSGTSIGTWEGDVNDEDWIEATDIESMLGLEPGALGNSRKKVRERIHPDDSIVNSQSYLEHLQGKYTVTEMRLQTGDGNYRWFRIFGRSEKDESGKVVGLAGTISDIDDLKRSQLAAAEQVRRRDEFLAMLSHELRNPMSAITYSADFIQSTDKIPEELNSFFDIITRQTIHMSRLLDDLLDVARINQNKIELDCVIHDFRREIQQVIDSLKPTFAEKDQQIFVNLPSYPLMVDGDPARLKQAFTNLLDNASKYTPRSGKIWFDISSQDRLLIAKIRDTGCGILPKQKEEIFDLFVQQRQPMHRTTGGMGVGLYLVKHIIESHGGNVSVSSAGEEQGSEFCVELPLEELAIDPSPSGDKVMFANLKLAFVEDNDDTRNVMTHLLTQRGIEVFQFSDGETAGREIPLLRPDVAVIDIGLPGKNGYELAREIRQNKDLDSMVLIALSGYGQEADRIMAGDSGFDDHVVKPTRVDNLCELIAKHVKL